MKWQQIYAARQQVFLMRLAQALKCPGNAAKADRILHAVLHTLRSRLSLNDALQLLRLLPVSLKYVFMENWNFACHRPELIYPNQFVGEVMRAAHLAAPLDCRTEAEAEAAVRTIFCCLDKRLSSGKRQRLRDAIPASLHGFLEPSEVNPLQVLKSLSHNLYP